MNLNIILLLKICTCRYREVKLCNDVFNIPNEHLDNDRVNVFLKIKTNCAAYGTFWTHASGSGNTQQCFCL